MFFHFPARPRRCAWQSRRGKGCVGAAENSGGRAGSDARGPRPQTQPSVWRAARGGGRGRPGTSTVGVFRWRGGRAPLAGHAFAGLAAANSDRGRGGISPTSRRALLSSANSPRHAKNLNCAESLDSPILGGAQGCNNGGDDAEFERRPLPRAPESTRRSPAPCRAGRTPGPRTRNPLRAWRPPSRVRCQPRGGVGRSGNGQRRVRLGRRPCPPACGGSQPCARQPFPAASSVRHAPGEAPRLPCGPARVRRPARARSPGVRRPFKLPRSPRERPPKARPGASHHPPLHRAVSSRGSAPRISAAARVHRPCIPGPFWRRAALSLAPPPPAHHPAARAGACTPQPRECKHAHAAADTAAAAVPACPSAGGTCRQATAAPGPRGALNNNTRARTPCPLVRRDRLRCLARTSATAVPATLSATLSATPSATLLLPYPRLPPAARPCLLRPRHRPPQPPPPQPPPPQPPPPQPPPPQPPATSHHSLRPRRHHPSQSGNGLGHHRGLRSRRGSMDRHSRHHPRIKHRLCKVRRRDRTCSFHHVQPFVECRCRCR